MSVYDNDNNNTGRTIRQSELHLYGSSRLGLFKPNGNRAAVATNGIYTRRLGRKEYELTDHLGNVRAVVGDYRESDGANPVRAALRSYFNHYAFGLEMPGMVWKGGGYRYGFNGKEQDADFANNYDYGFRIYNPGVGRFLSVDPLADKYPYYSPYQFAGLNPVFNIDLDGLEPGGHLYAPGRLTHNTEFEHGTRSLADGKTWVFVTNAAMLPTGLQIPQVQWSYWNRDKGQWVNYSPQQNYYDLAQAGQKIALVTTGVVTLAPLVASLAPVVIGKLSTASLWASANPVALQEATTLGVGLVAGAAGYAGDLPGALDDFGRAGGKGLNYFATVFSRYRSVFSKSKSNQIGNLAAVEGQIGKFVIDGIEESGAMAANQLDNIFDATIVNGYLRSGDSEYKILTKIAMLFDAKKGDVFDKVKGTLTVASERAFCSSCEGVIQEFQKMFPNVKLNFVNGTDKIIKTSPGKK